MGAQNAESMTQSWSAIWWFIKSFCVSMAVGLVLGALVYVILTWMSRRKAGSANITRRPAHQSHFNSRNRPGFNRNSSYDRRSNNSLVSAAFSFHRQTSSSDHLDSPGQKSIFKADFGRPTPCSSLLPLVSSSSSIQLKPELFSDI
uniref:Uncharacterized protein n=1 Tax=Monopterus albus TaxID=43700 RepID=A0A3Q3J3S6_MONAL